jgi:hypothetical protein
MSNKGYNNFTLSGSHPHHLLILRYIVSICDDNGKDKNFNPPITNEWLTNAWLTWLIDNDYTERGQQKH